MTRRSNIDERQWFEVEHGQLVRTVSTLNERWYSHRCTLESYTEVAYFVEEHAAEGVTTTMLWESLHEVPCTHASVAIAFLKERGCVEVRGRRMFPTSDSFFEDAMVEIHALAEEPPDAVRRAKAAQRQGDWPKASTFWRAAADTCRAEMDRARYLQFAAWCDDMREIVGERGQP
jgi:hypothetical protein